MSRRTSFLGAIAIQFLLLFSVIGYKQYTIVTGTTVVLQVEPLDPRSLFRGDYVRLNYTISTLDLNQVGGDDFFGYRQTVYVELAPGENGLWQAVSVEGGRRDVPDGHVLIKARTELVNAQREPSTLRLRYGIEEVFIPEGSGRDVEQAGNRVLVEVKVDRFGNAVPRHILIDGQPFNLKRR
jgi:uncharacterized membrane-anchored protein